MSRQAYCAFLLNTQSGFRSGLPPAKSRNVASLRMRWVVWTGGVKDEDFTRMHDISIREAFDERLDEPIAAGLLEWHEGALRLTRLGMDLQNSVLVDLL